MKVTVLIVDDEEHVRTMLANHFEFLGYEVRMAENGKGALSVLSAERVDIVITDIRMPIMGGDELCGRIRVDFPFTRIIVMTGHVNLESALACLRRGADYCFFKPIEDINKLEAAVRTCVDVMQHWATVLQKIRQAKVE